MVVEGTNATNKEGEKAPPSAADVFQKPTPTEAAHDPRVMTLKATTDRITAALTTVRDRLKDMKTALEKAADRYSVAARKRASRAARIAARAVQGNVAAKSPAPSQAKRGAFRM